MEDELLQAIHCHKCKKRTTNINTIKIQTINGRYGEFQQNVSNVKQIKVNL